MPSPWVKPVCAMDLWSPVVCRERRLRPARPFPTRWMDPCLELRLPKTTNGVVELVSRPNRSFEKLSSVCNRPAEASWSRGSFETVSHGPERPCRPSFPDSVVAETVLYATSAGCSATTATTAHYYSQTACHGQCPVTTHEQTTTLRNL
jgi:hypothetical protein